MTRVVLQEGLQCLEDEELETFQLLFSDLMLCTPETCGTEDLLTFGKDALYFAAIKYIGAKRPDQLATTALSTGNPDLFSAVPSNSEDSQSSTFIFDDSESSNLDSEASDDDSSTSGWSSDDPWSSEIPSRDPISQSSIANIGSPSVGFVYFLSTYKSPYLDDPTVLSVGIILKPPYRGMGLAQEAMEQALTVAFERLHCHRVQAEIIDGPNKRDVMRLFTKLRFGHEGTLRRSFFSSYTREWKDTTCLAMLETDWAIHTSLDPAPSSFWDEMFLRHERERDALLRWDEWALDEQRSLLRRSDSTETVCDLARAQKQEMPKIFAARPASKGHDAMAFDVAITSSPHTVVPERPQLTQAIFLGNEASNAEYQMWYDDDSDEEFVYSDEDEEDEEASRALPVPRSTTEISNDDPWEEPSSESPEGSQWDTLEMTSAFSEIST